MQGRVVSRSVLVPEDLDIELKVVAARARADKSDLYEAGARIVISIYKEGKLPPDLGRILRLRDPKALEILAKVVTARG